MARTTPGHGGQEASVELAAPACREASVVTFTLQRPEAWLALVGEAGFQEALDRHSGGRDEDGAVFPHHAAVLLGEPHNRYDRDAIAVYVCDEEGVAEKVGYLSQADAFAYGPILRLVSPSLPMCLLAIHGGWDRGPTDRRYHSASLNIGSPAEMAAEWFFDHHPPRHRHRWRGMTVTFVGRSPFLIGGIRLDRPAQAFLAVQAGCVARASIDQNVAACIVGGEEPPDGRPGSVQPDLRDVAQLGIECVDEGSFWRDLGYDLDLERDDRDA